MVNYTLILGTAAAVMVNYTFDLGTMTAVHGQLHTKSGHRDCCSWSLTH